MATYVRSDGQTWIHRTFPSRGLSIDIWLWNISNMHCMRWCNRPFSHFWISMLTHFMSVVSVYNPCKHQNLRYFDVFREYTKSPMTWKRLIWQIIRSSRSQMFFKIGVLKNFANFTGKHLCWSLFFKKLQV